MASGCQPSKSQEGGAAIFDLTPTGQTVCYNEATLIPCPAAGLPFFGQDAQYNTVSLSYADKGDGTVTDLITGLMWKKDYEPKTSLDAALAAASSVSTGGHKDWRVPTIKELYSLINFNGRVGITQADSAPFIDTRYFNFAYGSETAGERFIDAQYLSSTVYSGTTMRGDATVFGVNFADGRIKGYPRYPGAKGAGGHMFVRYVRGSYYGNNQIRDKNDGTIYDQTTGLTWMKEDSASLGAGAMDWEHALAWCENLDYGGRATWRLPNAKELQSIVDYTRSPTATGSASIDRVFTASKIAVEGGQSDYGFYWTSTTHLNGPNPGSFAVYISFGRALGYMPSPRGSELMDVHGAGAQRSDPKSGDPSKYPFGLGPQGDVIRIYNLVRCVSEGGVIPTLARIQPPGTATSNQ